LEPFIEDIKILQTEGINVFVNGVKRNYKDSLLFVAGDTPFFAMIGSFKESVSAIRPCRMCMTTQAKMKIYFTESLFILRDGYA